jgi:hypothetical protein
MPYQDLLGRQEFRRLVSRDSSGMPENDVFSVSLFGMVVSRFRILKKSMTAEYEPFSAPGQIFNGQGDEKYTAV